MTLLGSPAHTGTAADRVANTAANAAADAENDAENESEELAALGGLAETVFGDIDIEATRSPAYSNETVADEHDRRLWRTLAETGLLAAVLTESAGGGGLGVPGMVRLLIEAGAALARVPLAETLITACVVAESGTAAQRDRVLPGIMTGETVVTAALAEHPSLIAHPLTLAGHKLSGIIQFVPYPLSSDSVLVPARRPDGREVLALVSLSTARVADQVPTTGEPLGILEFIGVDVIDVFDAAPRARQLAALFASAQLCGIGAKALAMTAEYVSKRIQFGHPLASFQGVALRVADRYIDSKAMQAACWEATRYAAGPEPSSPRARAAVAAAKIWAAEGARRIVGSAQHLHGGFGVDVTYPLHRYHAWARYWELYGGSAAAWTADLGDLVAAYPIEEDE